MKYKSPPVVERLLTVVADCPDERYYSKLEGWKSIVLEHFPVFDALNDWRLVFEERPGGLPPVMQTAQPELTIIHRFWRLDKKGKKFLSMRFLKNQFTINLHPTADDPHPFEELFAEYSVWLPRWMAHFELTGCSGLHLDYVNLISPTTTPKYVDPHGGIQIGRMLKFLGSVPGPYVRIIPPYSSEVTMLVDEERHTTWTMRVIGENPEKGQSPAVRVDFKTATSNPAVLKTSNEVLSEAQKLHTVLIKQFEEVFSDEAKSSFEPIKQ